jgi:hypothetical protein
MITDREVTRLIIARRLVKQTKDVYRSKIKYIINYFKNNVNEEYRAFVNDNDELMLPLPLHAIQDLFGHLSTDTELPKNYKLRQTVKPTHESESESESEDYEDDDGTKINKRTISYSCMGGYKSALKKYYEERNLAFEDNNIPRGQQSLNQWCNEFLDAYARNIADKRQKGVMAVSEGKSAISFDGYGRLNNTFISFKPGFANQTVGKSKRNVSINWSVGILCFTCSVLQWNNISRSEVLDRLHLPHFDWTNDCLKLTIVKSKKDQSGSYQGREKHLFANPFRPEICPILAIGLYTIAKDRNFVTNAKSKFFEGADQKHRYANMFRKVLESNDDDFDAIYGCNKNDLGTHSHRKGAATFLLGIVDGPNACAVYIRAGWSLGNTQDRYILGGAGEDQLCGRILSGLPLDSEDFAILPPHFSSAGLARVMELGFDSFLDGYSTYPDSFKRCVPYLLASVIYHLPKLNQWFPLSHPLWGAKMFTSHSPEELNELRSQIIVCSFNCVDTGLRCTGVPGNFFNIFFTLQIYLNHT